MTFEYGSDAIQVLRTNEHIRKRPQIFLGPLPNPRVINRLIEEALCLSVDGAECGTCSEITVSVSESGAVAVRDNGPGLSMEPMVGGRILAEILLTELGACRAAKQGASAKDACCHLGLVVVNALSETLRVRVFRAGACWAQDYRAGVAQAPFRREADTNETGLELSFVPDSGILGPQQFEGPALVDWLASTGVRFETIEYCPRTAEPQTSTFLRFHAVGNACVVAPEKAHQP